MTLTLPKRPAARRATRHRGSDSPNAEQAHQRCQAATHDDRTLERYIDWQGRPREVLARPGAAGSVLVVDRDSATGGDSRLVAHLPADEPAENAAILCRRYIEDVRVRRCRCRPVTRRDARTVPLDHDGEALLRLPGLLAGSGQVEARGHRYRLELVQTGMSIPELRWRRHRPGSRASERQEVVVSLRDVVARLESYEPARSLTRRSLALHRGDSGVSTTVLRAELVRVQNSPIVLNRGLREALLAKVEREQLSMSEIAIRCGRIKRDRRGNESGETSWLARRLGLLPEAGHGSPTPWIHSDVLALIARDGLGISPREAEVA
jgi:hypothetical protein